MDSNGNTEEEIPSLKIMKKFSLVLFHHISNANGEADSVGGKMTWQYVSEKWQSGNKNFSTFFRGASQP